MRFYKRVNQYILEHYPIAWNTNIFWMIVVGIASHLLFYLLGFLTTNLNLIKDSSFFNHFFSSSIVLFYAILVLVIVILWLLKVFKNNPLKSFYQVNKTYLFTVFFHFFISIFLLSTVYLSFNKGRNDKVKTLLNTKELRKEKVLLNKVYPFMLLDLEDYNFSNREYPSPFPLENLIGKDLNNIVENTYQTPQINKYKRSVEITETGTDNAPISPNGYVLNKTKPHVFINEKAYQFGDVSCKEIKCKSDVCKIDSFFDVSKVAELKKYSIANFSKLFITQELLDTNVYSYKNNIAANVHEIYFSKNQQTIKILLDSLSVFCKKYKIANTVDNNQISKLSLQALQNSYDNYKGPISGNFYSYEFGSGNKKEKNVVETNEIEYLFENYNDVITSKFKFASLWPYFFFALAMAYLLIMGKFSSGLNILLSIVFGGIIMIVFSLLSIGILSGGRNAENSIRWLILVYSAIVIGLGLISLNSKLSKWWRDKFAILTYAAIPVFMFSLLSLIYPKSTEKINECGRVLTIEPTFIPEAWHFAIVAIIALIPAFIYIKKWIAKPE